MRFTVNKMIMTVLVINLLQPRVDAQHPHSNVWSDVDQYKTNVVGIVNAMPADWSVCCVLKGDAYGHHIETLVPALVELKTSACIVDTWEARAVSQVDDTVPIVRIRVATTHDYRLGVPYNVQEAVGSYDAIHALNDVGLEFGRQMPLHINLDTSMGRAGFSVSDSSDVQAIVDSVHSFPYLKLVGFMTHLGAHPEKSNAELVDEFLDWICPVILKLEANGNNNGITVHWAASSEIDRLYDTDSGYLQPPAKVQDGKCGKNTKFMVRPGSMTYGFSSTWGNTHPEYQATILNWHTTVAHVSYLNAGDTVGYGHTIVTEPTVAATLPVGWSDGYPGGPKTSGEGPPWVIVADTWCALLANPTMNNLIVDVTHLNNTATTVDNLLGADVQLLGVNVSLSDLASWTGSSALTNAVTIGKARNDDLVWELECWTSSAVCPNNTPPTPPKHPNDYFHTKTAEILVALSCLVVGVFLGGMTAKGYFWLKQDEGANVGPEAQPILQTSDKKTLDSPPPTKGDTFT